MFKTILNIRNVSLNYIYYFNFSYRQTFLINMGRTYKRQSEHASWLPELYMPPY